MESTTLYGDIFLTVPVVGSLLWVVVRHVRRVKKEREQAPAEPR